MTVLEASGNQTYGSRRLCNFRQYWGLAGFSIVKTLRVIKEAAVIAMGTASSEAGFPKLIVELTQAGCDQAVVGFVLPTGYSFNIDGACLYIWHVAWDLLPKLKTPR